jgi:hypothetical protein
MVPNLEVPNLGFEQHKIKKQPISQTPVAKSPDLSNSLLQNLTFIILTVVEALIARTSYTAITGTSGLVKKSKKFGVEGYLIFFHDCYYMPWHIISITSAGIFSAVFLQKFPRTEIPFGLPKFFFSKSYRKVCVTRYEQKSSDLFRAHHLSWIKNNSV